MIRRKASTARKEKDVTAMMYHSEGTDESTNVRHSSRSFFFFFDFQTCLPFSGSSTHCFCDTALAESDPWARTMALTQYAAPRCRDLNVVFGSSPVTTAVTFCGEIPNAIRVRTRFQHRNLSCSESPLTDICRIRLRTLFTITFFSSPPCSRYTL